MFSINEVHASWTPIFKPHVQEINSILGKIQSRESTPPREMVFRAFSLPLDEVKVLVLGQDPYPSDGVADGLAFSSSRVKKIPASLRNIFLEYRDDLGFDIPKTGDLTPWLKEGVLLLNTALTTEVGGRDSDKSIGWQNLNQQVILELVDRPVVAILWGNSARALGKNFTLKIESSHPSPLSAHRGFLGSKPFTETNSLLHNMGIEPINWRLP